MRFGLLCDDLSASSIVEALAAEVGGHRLVRAARINQNSDSLLHGLGGTTLISHWEELLNTHEVDAVLLGGNDPAILQWAKQLATAGIPLLLVPHAAQGSTFAYELSLIHDDNHVLLYPWFWHRYDAGVNRFREGLQNGELGRVQFLQLERVVAHSSSGTSIPLPDVDAELLSDVDLLRWLMGDYNQVTSLRTAVTPAGVMMQSVVMSGRSLPEANWSIKSNVSLSQWRLTAQGERGTASLNRDPSQTNWICEFNGQVTAGVTRDTVSRQLAAFAAAVPDKKSATVRQPIQRSNCEWSELVKCFETIDATQRSVARRRTIELHFEPMSERAIFKTQMTAIGCGLLVATFFLSLGYLGIASLIPLPPPVLSE